MTYRVLTDFIVVIHLMFIIYALFGGLTVLWRKWLVGLHLPTVVWIVLIEFTGWICPLTPLENKYRLAAGMAGYSGSFIDHYLVPIIYPTGLTSDIQILLGAGAMAVNLAVYLFVFKRWQR